MTMSQRYPGYFDGIVSGDPAIRTGNSNLGLAFIEAAFNAAAPKDDSGKPAPANLLSDGDRKLLMGALLKACDAKDGVEDGMIYASERLANLSGLSLGHRNGGQGRGHSRIAAWFSPLDTINYYEKMSRENGGSNKVTLWSRLYLVPGMGHCQGGSATLDRFDMLSAITNWVEKGTAPDSVTATGKAFPGRSRPLCAYPSHAQYSGQGDPSDAKNFVCRAE